MLIFLRLSALIFIIWVSHCNANDPINDPTGSKLQKDLKSCAPNTISLYIYSKNDSEYNCNNPNYSLRIKYPSLEECEKKREESLLFSYAAIYVYCREKAKDPRSDG